MLDQDATDQLAEVWQQLLDRRARNMPLLIEHLAAAGLLRTGLTLREAADTVWAINSTEVYQLMTETRGWTAPQYERWLADTLIRLLLAADSLPFPYLPGNQAPWNTEQPLLSASSGHWS